MLNRKFKLWSVYTLAIFGLVGCSNSNSKTLTAQKATSQTATSSQANGSLTKLNSHYKKWQGTRYALGGTSKKGVDCSGFTQLTYRDLFGKSLPRMTVDQVKKGKKVGKNALKAGDLVFFNTGRGPHGKHVGIYLQNGQFMHASSKGVKQSNLNSPYWKKVFWQARRL